MIKKYFTTLWIVLIAGNIAYPCSAIVLKNANQILLAKNFDWTYCDGMVIKNLRGTTKTAYFTHTGTPAQWTSKYGSITFNQNGKEMPYGGMNEKGLVVEMLWLELTSFNISEQKTYLNELEWIQYQLDNYESVQQVIDQLDELKIYPIKGKIHYILTDSTGESVIIEYLNGKPTTYKKQANVCQTITNNSVLQSEPYKNNIDGVKKNNTAATYRYYKLEQEILNPPPTTQFNETYAFEVLKKVTIPKGDFKTQWSIVYNIQKKTISFLTDSHRKIKCIHLAELDFGKELSYLPLNQNKTKDLHNEFKLLTEPLNDACVSASLLRLGFDAPVAHDISQHQFLQIKKTTSIFANNYFHFNISVPIEEDNLTGFIAVMNSEENFTNRVAVTGGYLYGTVAKKGTLIFHIYGLKNGTYSMLTFVDKNKNKKLDFDDQGNATEKYATFSNRPVTNEQELNFYNTSADFNATNAQIMVQWKP